MNQSAIRLSVIANDGQPRYVAIRMNGDNDLPTICIRDAESVDRLIERLLQARTIAFGLPLVALPTSGFEKRQG